MNFHPHQDRYLIARLPAEQVIKGIIVPETSQEAPAEGIVVAHGPGKLFETGGGPAYVEPVFKKGDYVLFGKYSGQELAIKNGDEVITYTIMRDDEILGRCEYTPEELAARTAAGSLEGTSEVAGKPSEESTDGN